MRIEPATREALREYYGDAPLPTMRAYMVLDDDDKVIGVGGFVWLRRNRYAIFSESLEGERQKHRVTAFKFAKMLLKIADEHGWVLFADPDCSIGTAKQFLERLGFKPGPDGVYVR
jgi:hypothetical protein